MFITGPDVIKAVTGEEVGFEELGGAMSHNSQVGRGALRAAMTRTQCLEDTRYLLSFLPQNNLETAPRVQPTDDPLQAGARARPRRPRQPQQAVRHARRDPRLIVDDGEFFEVHEHYARNIVVRLCPPQRIRGRRRRQPALTARGRPRYRLLVQGRPLRAYLRRLQHPADHLLRRSRISARHQPGVGRHHPPRRQAPVRLYRGHRSEDHDHHAQGVWRGVRRHGLQAHARATSISPGPRPR